MQEMILILDFGSQVTQLIGRRLRELNVYCEIHPYNKIPAIGDKSPNVMEWAKLDTGFAAQNVYLACASMGLGTCARGSFKHEDLAPVLKLAEGKVVTLCMPVGVPQD